MKPTLKSLAALAVTLACNLVASRAPAQPVGQWDFNSGDLSATVGSPLGYLDAATQGATTFNTTAGFGIPPIAGGVASVMRFPANTTPQGYLMPVNAAASGGGSLVNQWTLIFDVLYPAESAAAWRPFIEIDGRIFEPDAEFFVDPSGGIGVNGVFDGSILANNWYRIGFVVDTPNDTIRKYINGALVGSQPATFGAVPAVDGRWALDQFLGAELFNDNDGQAAVGYVNSIQLRDVPLTTAQMQALGGPTAAGIPQVIPPIPSFVQSWIPARAVANRNTDFGAIIFKGDSTVSAIELRLDGQVLASPSITDQGETLRVFKASSGLLPASSDHVLQVSYLDSQTGGRKTNTHAFRAVILYEDFDGLTLESGVDRAIGSNIWTKTGPTGWEIDDTGVPGAGDPGNDGTTEFAGWSFVSRDWWGGSIGQQRENFIKGTGIIAVADPDEWDDIGHTLGLYNTLLKTPVIPLSGAAANTMFLKFDSAWRPEGCDDNASLDNNQTAVITVSYNGGAGTEVLRWDSSGYSACLQGGPATIYYHPDNVNETVIIQLNNPAGASSIQITFGLLLAENDWFWAVDNILVDAGVTPPVIVSQPPPIVTGTEGQTISLAVTATGEGPITYQWFKGTGAARTAIPGATSAQLTLGPLTSADAGVYTVTVTNPGGSAQSGDSQLVVLPAASGSVTNDLVVHLKFDDDLTDGVAEDTSGRGNHGAAMGAPTYVPGRLGTALSFSSARDGSFFNYVSLGTPEDLNFGTAVDFSISFWTKFTQWTGDPSFVANKNWNSGGNVGYVIATAGNGGLQWNAAPSRIDYDGPGRTLTDTNFHHVLFSWDRTGLISTYLDGVQVNNTANGAVRDLNSGLPTNIGQDGTGSYTDGGSVGIADGIIDDVGIWRRALTPAEAVAIYRAGLAGKDLSQATVAPPVGQDLVAFLGFEDNYNDGSGRNNNGTAVGAVSFVPGRVGKGLAYSSRQDGTSFNYVTLGTPADLNFGTSQSFSVSFWAKLNSWTGDPAFLANKDWNSGSNPGWVIATGGDGRIQWNIAGTATGANGNRRDYDSAGGVFTDLGWHHITVVFLRQPGSGVARTYVDGALRSENTWTGADNQLDTPAGKATNIGQDGTGTYTDGNSVGVDAVIDEVAIWRRALNADEVEGLYAAGVVGVPVTGASPALTLQLPPGRLAQSPDATRTTLTLTWRANQGVRLQRATSLVPGAWGDVPCTLGDGRYVTPLDPAQNEFFRLQRR